MLFVVWFMIAGFVFVGIIFMKRVEGVRRKMEEYEVEMDSGVDFSNKLRSGDWRVDLSLEEKVGALPGRVMVGGGWYYLSLFRDDGDWVGEYRNIEDKYIVVVGEMFVDVIDDMIDELLSRGLI